ncbi:MAG TPA: NADPH-dependent glutamate synthase [Candidatus Omnitrophota bacterium]|nr:NADPH-dependent glutamate synthase [Candidatus Omnitrophota bacterium]HQO58580.1 NADPH-dependent glutamate synthase [Candidatus Omnitrophota bacterium]
MKKEPVKIKERESSARVKDFEEVVQGFSEEEALREASRCIQCKDPQCVSGCPVGVDIKTFIGQMVKKDYDNAYFTIRQKNNFPSICGRVCPAEYQCRRACVFTKKGEPFASGQAIGIHFLERFIGDYGARKGLRVQSSRDDRYARARVAVVGSGPAGLCCAGELARRGVRVTVFEGLHKTGGVLRYGIPPFRLPRNILNFEIDSLKELGVEIRTNTLIGKMKLLEELFAEGFSAVFLGMGAGIPSFLGLPGENLCNIYSANEFLTRVNLMSAHLFPAHHTPINIGKHIVVIGGGNTAMDAARVAIRLQHMRGVEPDTAILYRRTEVEMPARRLEIEHAKEEGIKFDLLVKPEGFLGDEKGFVRKIRASRCELGEPDSTGRRRPIVMEGSAFEADCDLAIIAIGLGANKILTSATPQLATDKYGDVIINPETMETSMKGVFAGGDIVGGEGTVIEAMGMAKKAARSILSYLDNLVPNQ